jgi:hypothetical protein
MSWEATAYVKQLLECEDGAELRRGHKCLLFVLADYHNPQDRAFWPSVKLMADESLASLAQTKRDLEYLAEHCVIEKLPPKSGKVSAETGKPVYGAGHVARYRFLKIDAPERLRELLAGKAEGVQGEPLFCPEKRGSEAVQGSEESGSEGVHGKREKGSEGVQIPMRNKERTGNHEPETNAAGNNTRKARGEERNGEVQQTAEDKAALQVWLALKGELRGRMGQPEWKLWVRPAYLLRTMASTLLIALPANGRIIEAARSRLPLMREMAERRGYQVVLTRYPDDWERNECRKRFGKEAQTFGGGQ